MATDGVPTQVSHIYIGGYTSEMDGESAGIHSLAVSTTSDDQVELLELDPTPLVSPTYLVRHPSQPWLYAVSEGNPGQVSSLRIDETGALSLLSTVGSGDDGGCHLCLDPTGRFVVVAHYTSGSVATLAVGADGSLGEVSDLMRFTGSGPDPERQEAAHAHQVVCDGDTILVPDLGSDQVHVIRVDEHGMISTAGEPVRLPAGSGPRHLVVVDDHLVVACELSAELWVAPRRDGGWGPGRAVPSSAAETTARIYPSAVVADGRQVFVANRGSDTVAVFALDPAARTLTPVGEFGTAGQWPRDLVLSPNHAWVANQANHVISVFDRTGDLADPRLDFQIPSPSPACIVLTAVAGSDQAAAR
ncbi:6-phosphogluconolactonase (cycloisomerase 2 family) [Microlunatus panaciterrae]|uniref:6-phosphogluconolactonase (Cycloisomerase 2 family) n=1 Tax=Microlunatus panaciterrae TaxID=400768 RepID=A0ABS2RQV1_9ACTN|nr:lactonase family protein [Microlunatus panaciterrae]MBM7800299.1 6-phosphogluconolactonase (cycloisomerase 2 family) [Microlunatus panaciterrae]